MAYVWTDDSDDDDDNPGQNPPAKVELPAPARAHLKKLEKELKELREQNATYLASQRKNSVGDVLKAKGYDPTIADLIPSTVETSDEAIGKWLDERAHIFAKMKTPDADDSATSDTGSIDAETAAAFSLMGNVTSNAQTANKATDLLARLNSPNLTRAELDKIMRDGGAKF